MSVRNVVLGSLIAAILVTVAVHPHTAWVNRLQLGGTLGAQVALLKGTTSTLDAQLAVAARHPDNLSLQFGATLNRATTTQTRVPALRTLAQRFPEAPEVRAAILRFETMAAVRPLHYADEDRASAPVGAKVRTEIPQDPQVLAAYDQDAAVGERLAPDNAYFPLMRAIGLFGAGKDAAALEAVHRAATLPRYDDYVREDAQARWALSTATFGNTGTVVQVAQSAVVLFPHYSSLRTLARIVVGQAIQAEQAGDPNRGLALRHDLMRIGNEIRRDATSVIGCSVGSAITVLSGARPRGVVPPRRENQEEDARRALVVRAFQAYTQTIGRTEEGQAFQEAVARAEKSLAINKRAMDQGLGLFDTTPLVCLQVLWMLSSVALALLVGLLLGGGLLKGLGYTGRIREAKPLHPGVTAGLLFAVGSGPLGLLAVATTHVLPPLSAICWFASFALVLLAFWRLSWGISSGQHRAAVTAALLTLAVAGGLGLLVVLPILGGVQNVVALGSLVSSEGGPLFTLTQMRPLFVPGGLVLLLGVLPVLACAGIALHSARHGVPASVGIVRRLPRLVLPLALLAALLYAGLTGKVATQEALDQAKLHQTIQHEGRYNARLLGESWPE